MAKARPIICAAVTRPDAPLEAVAPLADMFEVRIDLVGAGWPELAKRLSKPWIACNRRAEEGGAWPGNESGRIGELMRAIGLGADILDIELGTTGVAELVREFKTKAKCLLSHHDFTETPPLETLKDIVSRQLAAGADICKVVTTANRPADNAAVLKLITAFPEVKVVAFAMGPLGHVSRVLGPLAGGYLAYAAIEAGGESAPGQLTVRELREIYEVLR